MRKKLHGKERRGRTCRGDCLLQQRDCGRRRVTLGRSTFDFGRCLSHERQGQQLSVKVLGAGHLVCKAEGIGGNVGESAKVSVERGAERMQVLRCRIYDEAVVIRDRTLQAAELLKCGCPFFALRAAVKGP